MKTGIDNFRKFLFWASILAAFPLLCTIFFPNGPWIAETILSAMLKLSIFALWISIIVPPPFFFFPKTREIAAYITESAYFLFSLTLWFMSVKITYWTFGPLVVGFGLLMLGLGCIPFSLILRQFEQRSTAFAISSKHRKLDNTTNEKAEYEQENLFSYGTFDDVRNFSRLHNRDAFSGFLI